jgi:dephospho-CoA kinase
MKIIGLTGSIGMGKSTAAKALRMMRVPVFCADVAVHNALKAGGAAVDRVAKLYPKAVKKTRGKKSIDRKILGAAAFVDKKLMKGLEKILHPLSRKAQAEFLKRAKKKKAKAVVLDIPLLFETGAAKRVDLVMVVSTHAHIQKKRVMARPGMTLERFHAILKKQMPDAEKRKRADIIIPTHTHAVMVRALAKALKTLA